MGGGGSRHIKRLCLRQRLFLVISLTSVAVTVLVFSRRNDVFNPHSDDHGKESSGHGEVSQLEEWLSERGHKVIPNLFRNIINSTSNEPSRGSQVLIMASQRSGSSFLGELFNRNQDVFYSFEPIRPLTFAVLRGELDNNQFENEAIAKLSNTLKCKDVRVYKRTGKSRTDRKLFDLTKACRNKRHVAVKEIRFYKLDTLRTLAEDPNLNFKIIHLVRDPRAIINSRENSFFSNHDFKRKRVPWDEVTDLCKDLQHNLDLITTLPQWLKGKYFLVRYEDLALRPLEATRDIYNFSGMPMDEDVEKWVYENTQTEQGGDLSTTRNSTERVTAWRNELSFSVIADIQNKCKEPMEMLGYISLQDQTQQNTLSLPVFTDETEFFNFPYIL